MITKQEIESIRARAEVAGRESASYTGHFPTSYVKWPGCRVCREDIPALMADREELMALARELAEALELQAQAFDSRHPGACHQECFDTSDGHGYEMQEAARKRYAEALAKARAVGLLEGE